MKPSQSILLKKGTSIIFFLILFYVLPLAGKLELLLNPQVLFLSFICTILFATQPRLSITESKLKKATDRNTIWLIILVSGLGQVVSLIEWAYFSNHSAGSINLVLPLGYEIENQIAGNENDFYNWTIIGSVLLTGGTIFRLYAINILGKYFSSTVQIKDEHKIIKTGPYRFLRHPSYTGAYLAMLGSAIFLHSFVGIFISGIGMLFVYHLRIKTEEKTLIKNFKEEYLNYRTRTYRMFPFVW